MMASSVGSVEFWSLRRDASPAGERVRRVTRPGVDGLALQKLGKQGETYFIAGIAHVINAAARKTLIDNAMALRSAIVDIVDDFGTTWTSIAILNVVNQGSVPLINAVGAQVAGATIKVTISFECVDAGAGD